MSTKVDIETSDLDLHANSQGFVLSIFGYLFALAAMFSLVFASDHLFNRWIWVIFGPVAAYKAVETARCRYKATEVNTYVAVLLAGLVGCGVIAGLVRQAWVVPTSLLVLAAVIGFMAWFEENSIGVTGAISLSLLSAGTSIVAYADQSAITYGLIAVMLLIVEPGLQRFAIDSSDAHQTLDLRSESGESQVSALSKVAATKA